MSRAAAKSGPSQRSDRPIRVMLVDDSGVTRALMQRWLGEAGIEVVAVASNGEEARNRIAACQPDIVILDIEMPRLGGIDVLPELLALVPGVRVVMASTLSTRSAEVTVAALRLGACDAIAKPTTGWAGRDTADFRGELIRKIKALGPRVDAARAKPALPAGTRRVETPPAADVPEVPAAATGPAPKLVVIGASTGGPNALFALLADLKAEGGAPILIAQHMPPTFTSIFAEHLQRVSGRKAAEAEHGEPLQRGRIYVAPGGRHMEVARSRRGGELRLTDAPPENFCRPSVNPLFRSAAAWGPEAFGIVLTGMGTDGLTGAKELKDAGARIFVQDAASSVVWGMPGAIARQGLADAVLPLDRLGNLLRTELAR